MWRKEDKNHITTFSLYNFQKDRMFWILDRENVRKSSDPNITDSSVSKTSWFTNTLLFPSYSHGSWSTSIRWSSLGPGIAMSYALSIISASLISINMITLIETFWKRWICSFWRDARNQRAELVFIEWSHKG